MANVHLAVTVQTGHIPVMRSESGLARPAERSVQPEVTGHDGVAAVRADDQRRPDLVRHAIYRRLDTDDALAVLNEIPDVGTFADGDPGCPRAVEQELIEAAAGEAKRARSRLGFRKIGREPIAVRRVDNHSVDRVRSRPHRLVEHADLGQNLAATGIDVVGTGLVARKAGLVEQEDAMPGLSQLRSHRAPGWSTADHDRLGVSFAHGRCGLP